MANTGEINDFKTDRSRRLHDNIKIITNKYAGPDQTKGRTLEQTQKDLGIK